MDTKNLKKILAGIGISSLLTAGGITGNALVVFAMGPGSGIGVSSGRGEEYCAEHPMNKD